MPLEYIIGYPCISFFLIASLTSFYIHCTFKFYKESCGVAGQCSCNHVDVEATKTAKLELNPCSVDSCWELLPSLSTESLVAFIRS